MQYQNQNQNQNQQQTNRPLDKGFIKVVVDQFVKKVNGQTVLHQGTTNPVMSNKYVTIGEVTRWPSEQGGSYDNVEFYPGFTILDLNKHGRIFWDSQSQNQNQQPPQGYQQQPQQQAYNQQQNSYQQAKQG